MESYPRCEYSVYKPQLRDYITTSTWSQLLYSSWYNIPFFSFPCWFHSFFLPLLPSPLIALWFEWLELRSLRKELSWNLPFHYTHDSISSSSNTFLLNFPFLNIIYCEYKFINFPSNCCSHITGMSLNSELRSMKWLSTCIPVAWLYQLKYGTPARVLCKTVMLSMLAKMHFDLLIVLHKFGSFPSIWTSLVHWLCIVLIQSLTMNLTTN